MFIAFVHAFNTKVMGEGLRHPRVITAEEEKALQMLINLNEREKDKISSIMNRFNDKSKELIYKNAMDYFKKQWSEALDIQEICSSLTPSEISICKLTLQDKSIKEIATALDKTVSNITCQRSHIRKKLGMSKDKNLREVLIEKLNLLE